jgi:hypothetical protein
MKVYEVEYRAVITLAAENMQKAAFYGAAVIKDNAHLIYVRAVHERKLELARGPQRIDQSSWEDRPGIREQSTTRRFHDGIGMVRTMVVP